jgi:TolB-like protein
MKRCPECGREYDNSMMFCLDDGAELLYGPASKDEPTTAVLSADRISSEQATRTFGRVPLTDSSTAPFRVNQAVPKKSSIVASLLGLIVVTVLGVSGYIYYGRGSAKQINSIAVLPFTNRSDDPDTEYLSDGLAESLIFRLTQLPDLRVSPTSSVMRYKGNESDVMKIASELGVDAIMTGRLAKRGDNLNITVELVDARNNKSLWGEQYERKMSDLLATQREIAAVIAQKLQLKLGGDERAIAKKYTDNNDAYQLWLKGRFHFARRTKVDMFRSIDLFKQAVELDPNFALAYVGIAESYTTIPSYPYASPQECVPQAKAAVARALELDPDLPEAHTVAGMIASTHDWEYPEAEREFKRALELDPNLAITHYRYAWVYLSPLGRHDEAIAEMKRAMELEPLSIQQGANYAAVLMYAGRFDEALEQAKKTNELDPTHVGGLAWLAHTYNAKGMYKESLAVSERALHLASYQGRAQKGIAYALGGERGEAMRIVNEWKEAEKAGHVMIYWLAAIYALLGDKDAAFAELEKSFAARDWFLQRLKTDPFMAPLRDDPRYKEMLKRLNLPE